MNCFLTTACVLTLLYAQSLVSTGEQSTTICLNVSITLKQGLSGVSKWPLFGRQLDIPLEKRVKYSFSVVLLD